MIWKKKSGENPNYKSHEHKWPDDDQGNCPWLGHFFEFSP